jgi:hypothetical protein
MRPGLEEWFEQETAELRDAKIVYAVRVQKWLRLIQLQEGVVRIHGDGSIVSPISPDDVTDAKEYLDRLRKLSVPL